MRGFLALSMAALLAGAATGSAVAQAPGLQHPAPIAKDNDSLPRLAPPLTDAEARVNLALGKLDSRWRAFRADCRRSSRDNDTSRSVKVTLQTATILSIVASDEASCSGAHPDEGQLALVYDLTTGRPVDWASVLGRALVTSTTLDSTVDGTKVGLVVSPKLQGLYLAKRKAERGWDAECGDVLDDPGLAFELWPDAKAGGLVLAPGSLPHVVQACGAPVAIPTATLRPLGADAHFLDAIDAAHRGG
jgi:hypothetical protein